MTETFDAIVRRRYTRRDLLRAGAVAAPALLLPDVLLAAAPAAAGLALSFPPITGSTDDVVRVPPGYDAQVLLRWGDPLFPGAPALDPRGIAAGVLMQPGAAAAQRRQFGDNCDGLGFFPLQADGRRGLLCVNHEYTNDHLMFPGRREMGPDGNVRGEWSRQHLEAVRVAMAAHGLSVVEIELVGESWRPRSGSRYTRRITADTPMEITGPARGHRLLRTRADRTGTRVLGTFANCSAGRTPWGTYLTSEENFQDYFGGLAALAAMPGVDPALLALHRRFPMHDGGSFHGWENLDPRFHLDRDPHEALRFGWMVEIDPRDPRAPGRKRTALGRMMHESAACTATRDGRAVVYLGDDDVFEYVYKFVSRGRIEPARGAANGALLDDGVLHVARFDADGAGEWLPLVHGQGPLVAANGFADAGEVSIKTRLAADRLGATPMDRPEDIAIHPSSGRIYVALTMNHQRTADARRGVLIGRDVAQGVDAANPRPANARGHIVEIIEDGEDAAAGRFRWNLFLLPGDPQASDARFLSSPADLQPGRIGSADTYYAGFTGPGQPAPMACPDNLGFDAAGHLWMVTDGAQPHGYNNGAFAVPVTGPERGYVRQFMSGPKGAEIAGCEFTPDGETLFLSVQHPGEGGTPAHPESHWPDGGDLPPRSSVIAIRKRGGGRVGS